MIPPRRPALFFFAMLTALAAPAAETLPAAGGEEGEWSITTAVASRYMFRGVRVGGESFQPSVDYARGPLALGLWSSIGLADQVSGDSDPEVDFYAAYSFGNDSERWSVTPGINVYTYPDAERADGLHRATFEPSLAVSAIVGGIRFTPAIYHDLTLRGTTAELTAEFAVPLTALGTELGFSAAVGTYKWNSVTADASPREKNWGDYWSAGVALPFQLSARSSVSLAVAYAEGRNNFYKQGTDPKRPNDDAVGRVVVTLGYTVTL